METKFKILADPIWGGRGLSELHDNRWIVTDDAEVEWDANVPDDHDPGVLTNDWYLVKGSLIAQMRDVNPKYATLLAAAPELLDALKSLAAWTNNDPCFCDAWKFASGRPEKHQHSIDCDKARAAITKATQP